MTVDRTPLSATIAARESARTRNAAATEALERARDSRSRMSAGGGPPGHRGLSRLCDSRGVGETLSVGAKRFISPANQRFPKRARIHAIRISGNYRVPNNCEQGHCLEASRAIQCRHTSCRRFLPELERRPSPHRRLRSSRWGLFLPSWALPDWPAGRLCRMETMRLRSIQQPGRVDGLLESFITGTNRVPQDAYQVRAPSELSELSHDLRTIAQEAHRKHRAWSAWTGDRGTWLFTAEMSLALSRERGAPVLQVFAYSEYGELLETGFWMHGKHGNWQRCAD